MTRCFIAIDLPENVRKELAEAQKSFPKDVSLRPVSTECMHLTVKFLGEIDDRMISRVKDGAEKACSGIQEFTCKVHGIGAFPNPNSPRVVWAGLEDDGSIARLQRAVDSEMKKLGFEDDVKFTAHLTLFRVKDAKRNSGLCEKITSLKSFEGSRFEVTEIALKKSILTPRGPEYSDLARFALARRQEKQQ